MSGVCYSNVDLQGDTVFLSLFYTVLSLLMIFFVTKGNRNIFILSGLYFLLVGVMVWMAGFKWLLIGSISFMVMVMFYTLWIVHEQSRACIQDLKAIREEEKKTQQFNDSKESL